MVDSYRKSGNAVLLKQINVFCCIYICVWNVVPVFRSITNQGVFRFIFASIVGIWLLTSLLMSRRWFYELLGISIFGSIYIIIMIIYYFLENGDMSIVKVVDPTILFVYTYMGYYYFSQSNIKTIKIILSFISICFIVTAITTCYNLLSNINVSRLVTSSSISPDIVRSLERRNVAGFDFIYGIVILIPVLFCGLKSSKETKNAHLFLIMLLIIFLSITVVILSNFLTAYFLLMVVLFLSLFIANKKIYLFLIIGGSLGIILSPFILKILIYVLTLVKDITPSVMTQNKINNIINILQGNYCFSSLSIRTSLLRNSIRSFLSSPVIGVGAYYHNPYIIGNHSQFIDDLGRYGIVGAIPMFIFMVYLLKKIKKRILNIKIKNAFMFSCIIFLLLGFLNPIQSYGIMFSVFFILPITSKYFHELTKTNNRGD